MADDTATITTDEQITGSDAAPSMAAPAAPAPTTDAAATQPTDQAAAPVRKLAGRFEKPEELEAEFLRKEGEVAALNRLATAPRPGADPTPKADPHADITDSQLVELKEANLLAASNAELSVADRQKAIRQVTLIEAEQQKRTISNSQKAERQSAAQRNLASKAQAALKPYEKELVPGNPLNDAAFEIFKDLVAAGNPDNPITRGLAVLSAAQIMGHKATGQAVAADRSALIHNLNKAAKDAVQAGAGGASAQATAPPNFATMTAKEFADYERNVLGLGV